MASFAGAGRLGIDFGTSNSAASVLVNGTPYHIEIEPGQQTLPTSVFFDFANRQTKFGNAANSALIEGQEGRFMRSLKSVLGTPLMHEKRQIMDQKMSFVDIIGQFLKRVKDRAEEVCHQEFHTAVSGRPVRFHSADPKRDQQALVDLTECYLAAGFKDVEFVLEPEAAAIANGAASAGVGMGLIVDIGGGTSDFTVFSRNGSGTGIDILASHGVRVGGTNFDKSISVDHVMPLFGKGSEVRREMGPGLLPAPSAIYFDLATWEKIPFLYNGSVRQEVKTLTKLAVNRPAFERLSTVLDMEIGHDIAFVVERGKIQANRADQDRSNIDLRMVEPGLSAPLTKDAMVETLSEHVAQIRDSAAETLKLAECAAEDIERVVFVGGSSLMQVVEQAMAAQFPAATLEYTEAFTAVVDGLAISAAGEKTA
ncbi:MAG: Hsp70 family protein [Marinosulfonomonas sp.]